MASINAATIIGNLGGDIELRSAKNGTKIANLRVATSYKPKEGDEETTWHNVVVFGAAAEAAAKYLKKGSLVAVEGRIQNKEYEKDGVKRWSSEIIANNVQFLDRPEKKDKKGEKDAGGES